MYGCLLAGNVKMGTQAVKIYANAFICHCVEGLVSFMTEVMGSIRADARSKGTYQGGDICALLGIMSVDLIDPCPCDTSSGTSERCQV